MKKLFSILTALIIGGSSIVLAMHVNQQDPLCFDDEHEGYTYPQGEIPPEDSNPENLPAGMGPAEIFKEDFLCQPNDQKTCHWVYNEDEARWKPCSGDYEVIPN